MTLKRDAIWTAIDTLLTAGLAFGFRLVVARMVSPEEFGLAVIVLGAVAVLQVVSDFGLTAALIQRNQGVISDGLVNTTFTVSCIVALLLACVTMAVLAPLAADFYGAPLIEPMLTVLAVSLLFSPFTTVASALVMRERRFKEVAVVRVAANLTGVAVAAGLLWLQPGAWVLIVQALVVAVLLAAGLVTLARWPFRFRLERAHLRSLFGFSSFVLVNDLLVASSANAGIFILGRLVPAAEVGLFGLATYLTETVRRTLMSILNRVTFVHYSTHQDNHAELRRAYISTLTWNCRAVFPTMVAMIFFAPRFLVHFLGADWAGMTPVIGWLSLSVMIHSAGGTTSTLYKAINRPGLDLTLFAATTFILLFPGMILGGLVLGLEGVAIATAATKFVSIVIRQILLERLIGGTAGAAARSVARLLVLQVPIVACWLVAKLAWPSITWIGEAAALTVGLAIYAALEAPRAIPALRRPAALLSRAAR